MNLEFHDITLDTKPLIESFTKPWELECSDFSFTNLFIWGIGGKMQYAVKEDVLYIKLHFHGVPEYLWSPLPRLGQTGQYGDYVKTALDYLREQNTVPTLRSVGIRFKELISQHCPALYINPTPQADDYVYLSENMIGLKGKKLHGKRNHINKFMTLYPDFEYGNLDETMMDECMHIYNEWFDNKDDEESKALADERKSVELALRHMTALGLTGGCIRLNGKIEAFTLGERLTKDMQLIHIEKANPSINGLYPMINQQYAIHNCADVTFINREEDMGLQGMRQAKRSYQPVRMIEKHIVTETPLEELKNLWGNETL